MKRERKEELQTAREKRQQETAEREREERERKRGRFERERERERNLEQKRSERTKARRNLERHPVRVPTPKMKHTKFAVITSRTSFLIYRAKYIVCENIKSKVDQKVHVLT